MRAFLPATFAPPAKPSCKRIAPLSIVSLDVEAREKNTTAGLLLGDHFRGSTPFLSEVDTGAFSTKPRAKAALGKKKNTKFCVVRESIIWSCRHKPPYTVFTVSVSLCRAERRSLNLLLLKDVFTALFKRVALLRVSVVVYIFFFRSYGQPLCGTIFFPPTSLEV